jgi:hypothetical protein
VRGSIVGAEFLDRRTVKVHLVVDDKQRVVGVHNVVVHTHTIQVLLQQALEEHILLLQCCLLFVDGKSIE